MRNLRKLSVSSYVYPGLSTDWKLKSDSSIDAVCRHYGFSRNTMMEKSRKGAVVEARYVAMYLIRKNTTYSLHAIGAIFKKDHATVLWGVKTVSNLLEVDKEFKERMRGFLC